MLFESRCDAIFDVIPARWPSYLFALSLGLAGNGRLLDGNLLKLSWRGFDRLGHAIAHESGHVLLPLGHAKSGLMAAQMDAMAIQAAIRGKLLFLPEQAERMRRILAGQ